MVASRVAVVVLAAGRSTRFGSSGAHKLLAPLCGSPVIRWAASSAFEAAVGDVVVVVGAQASVLEAALAGLAVRFVHALGADAGMSASLREGIGAVRGSVDAVIVSLADQPTMRPEAYRRVVSTWLETGAAIVTPRYLPTTSPAHPTLFDARVFDELSGLTGDVGARAVIARDPTRVALATMDWAVPRDIDTVSDLAQVEAELRVLPKLDREQ